MAGAMVDLADILELVRKLSPEDQSRLVEQIELGLPEAEPLESLEGLWAGSKPMPSLEEMQVAREEIWGRLGDREFE